MKTIHDVRENFKLEDFLGAREKTLGALSEVQNRLEAGMNEEDCLRVVTDVFNQMGVEKKWHPSKFRIGEDTLCSFKEKSQKNSVLSEGEIFFIDIGPVWGNYEGDIGRTFIFGEDKFDYKKIVSASQKVFEETSNHWQESGVSGEELYQFASEFAGNLGFRLNSKMAGHRLGDFPHHLFYRGSLAESQESPVPNLWVLEILLSCEKSNRGAFYEDILVKK